MPPVPFHVNAVEMLKVNPSGHMSTLAAVYAKGVKIPAEAVEGVISAFDEAQKKLGHNEVVRCIVAKAIEKLSAADGKKMPFHQAAVELLLENPYWHLKTLAVAYAWMTKIPAESAESVISTLKKAASKIALDKATTFALKVAIKNLGQQV